MNGLPKWIVRISLSGVSAVVAFGLVMAGLAVLVEVIKTLKIEVINSVVVDRKLISAFYAIWCPSLVVIWSGSTVSKGRKLSIWGGSALAGCLAAVAYEGLYAPALLAISAAKGLMVAASKLSSASGLEENESPTKINAAYSLWDFRAWLAVRLNNPTRRLFWVIFLCSALGSVFGALYPSPIERTSHEAWEEVKGSNTVKEEKALLLNTECAAGIVGSKAVFEHDFAVLSSLSDPYAMIFHEVYPDSHFRKEVALRAEELKTIRAEFLKSEKICASGECARVVDKKKFGQILEGCVRPTVLFLNRYSEFRSRIGANIQASVLWRLSIILAAFSLAFSVFSESLKSILAKTIGRVLGWIRHGK